MLLGFQLFPIPIEFCMSKRFTEGFRDKLLYQKGFCCSKIRRKSHFFIRHSAWGFITCSIEVISAFVLKPTLIRNICKQEVVCHFCSDPFWSESGSSYIASTLSSLWSAWCMVIIKIWSNLGFLEVLFFFEDGAGYFDFLNFCFFLFLFFTVFQYLSSCWLILHSLFFSYRLTTFFLELSLI